MMRFRRSVGVRIVLDTNIVVSAVFWGGKPLAILRAWAQGRLSIVGTPEILWEYERVLIEVAKRKVTSLGTRLSSAAIRMMICS